MMDLTLNQVLSRYPLRVSITDYCNVGCFFCSNEGMPEERKNSEHVDLENFAYLVDLLAKNGLKHISLTGGDPTLHPELDSVIRIINSSCLEQKFFHTNGVLLDKKLLDLGIKDFSKIAVSIHAMDYNAWHRITGGSSTQYEHLHKNLLELEKSGMGKKVEIKHVPIRGFNDDYECLKQTLDLCAKYGFKFKFLNFEAVKESHLPLVIPYSEFTKKLESLGCVDITEKKSFRGQDDYLPMRWYSYYGTKGVAIEIGCGEESVCKSCYKSNEIYLTPGLEIKPCHVSSHSIPLVPLIMKRDEQGILDSLMQSREFLFSRPGREREYWGIDHEP